MKTRFLAFLSACACACIASAEVKPYDFNSLVATGSGTGSAVFTVDGVTKVTQTVGGAYKLVATGVSAGTVHTYSVTVGGSVVDSGEVKMGNATGTLFGADASTGSSEVTAVTVDTTAPYSEPVVSDSVYTYTGSSNKFDVTSSPVGKLVTIESTMNFSDGADELDESLAALGAFTLAQTNETDSSDYFWAGLTGGSTKWVKLTGVTAAAGTYVSRMEIDLQASTTRIRYSLKASGASDFTVLKSGDTEWFACAASASQIASVVFEGTGTMTKFAGSSVDVAVAQVGSTTYTSMESALTGNDKATVTLLTNSRIDAGATLSGKSWTMSEGDYTFDPVEVTGYEMSYANHLFSVTPYVAKASASGSATIGCDFTNGTLNVSIADTHIQSGTTASVTVTVKNEAGTVVASKTYTVSADNQTAIAIPDPIVAKGTYSYDIVVTADDATLAEAHNTFVAGRDANWFAAYADHWTDAGSWTKNGEAVTPSGSAIALGGDTYAFTPTSASGPAIVRVDTVITVDGAMDNDDLPAESNVQGMVAITETSATDATPVWKAYVGSAWVALTGGDTDSGTYTVRAEFDYTRSPKAVRYSVSKDGGAFVVLKNGDDEWLANDVADSTQLTQISACGVGNLTSLTGENIDAYVAEANGVKYESLSAALAASDTVSLLWDCTWTPSVKGFWTISGSDKLTLLGAANWGVSYENGVLQASDTKVAQVGSADFYLLKDAFAAVTDGATVKLLTNVVQGADLTVGENTILDLSGWFLSGAANTLATATGKSLVFTNAATTAGGFAMNLDDAASYTIAGGEWTSNDGNLATGYKFIALNELNTVDGVDYTYQAMATTANPETSKVVPIVDGSTNVNVVVTDAFIEQHIGTGKTAAEVQTALNATRTTGNKLPLIQSYVLGLDPTSATSTPVVESAQVTDTDKVGVALGNVSVNADAGVKVRYSLSESTDPTFATGTTGAVQDSSTFKADVPTAESKVKYYKINIHFGN